MGNLGDIFEKRLAHLGIKKQVDAAMICEAFDKAVFEVFSESGAKNVRAVSFRSGVLKVGVTSSAWANEVSLRQIDLRSGEVIRIVYESRVDML
ncbi:MAG: DciA family protein [bacterium]|nr:DciA family protein [bacterium]